MNDSICPTPCRRRSAPRVSATTRLMLLTALAAARLHAQQDQTVTGNLSVAGTAAVNSTTASTSSTTGALTVGGGVGVQGNVNIAGGVSAATFTAGAGSIIGSASGLTLLAGGTNQSITLTPSGTGATILNGDVGIGTAVPAAKLEVAGDAKVQGDVTLTGSLKGASGGLTLKAGGTNQNVTINPSGSGATVFSGNVGIGAGSPTSKLSIAAGTTTHDTSNPVITIEGSDHMAGNEMTASIGFADDSATGGVSALEFKVVETAAGGGNEYVFRGGTPASDLRIQGPGLRFGIDTWLSRNGVNSLGTGNLTVGGNLAVNGVFTAANFAGEAVRGGSTGLALTAGGTDQNVTITPSGTGATILNGNVGIGTTDHSAKLSIAAPVGTAVLDLRAPSEVPSRTAPTPYAAAYGISFGPGAVIPGSAPAYVPTYLDNGALTFSSRVTEVNGSGASPGAFVFETGQVLIGTNVNNGVDALQVNGSIGGVSGLALNAGGANQNVTLTPSGTGATILNGNVGIGTASPASKLAIVFGRTTSDTSNPVITFSGNDHIAGNVMTASMGFADDSVTGGVSALEFKVVDPVAGGGNEFVFRGNSVDKDLRIIDGRLKFGLDASLYRSAVNTLLTNGNLSVGGALNVTGTLNTASLQIAGQPFNPANYVQQSGGVVTGTLSASALTATGGGITGGTTGLTLNAGGTDQSVTLLPSGAGVVNIGAGTSGNLRVKGTTSAADTSTGALVVSGGVAIAENLFVGKRLVVSKSFGQLPAGPVNGSGAGHYIGATGVGDAGGTTDFRPIAIGASGVGSNPMAHLRGLDANAYWGGTAALSSISAMRAIAGNYGSGPISSVEVISASPSISGTGNITGKVQVFSASLGILSSTGDLVGDIYGFSAGNLGRAGAQSVTAFDAADQTKGVGNAYGFRGELSAGTGKYNLFMDGTAANVLAGQTTITNATGSTSASTGALVVAGGAGVGQNLNVGGNATVAGTFRAANYEAANGTIAGGASGLTMNAGGAGDQNITLTPTGAGATILNGSTKVSGTMAVGSLVDNAKGLYVTKIGTYTGGDQTASLFLPTWDAAQLTNRGVVIDGYAALTGTAAGGSITIFRANGANLGTATVGTYTGFLANNAPAGATAAYGVRSSVMSGGGNRWNIYADGTAPNLFYGQTSITNTTPSTSSSTGALVVSGGAGVGGNLNVGGSIAGGGSGLRLNSVGQKLDVMGTELLLGADEMTATARTDATVKRGRWGAPHYLNAKEPVLGMWVDTRDTANNILYGGGSSAWNTATKHVFYTAPNTTTLNGASTFTIDNTRVLVSPSTVSTSASTGALVVTGGAGIGGDLNVAGAFSLNGQAVTPANYVLKTGGTMTGALSATSLQTGAGSITGSASNLTITSGATGANRDIVLAPSDAGDVVIPNGNKLRMKGATTRFAEIDLGLAAATDTPLLDFGLVARGGMLVGHVDPAANTALLKFGTRDDQGTFTESLRFSATPAGSVITGGAAGLTLNAGGASKNITLAPSGTGSTLLYGNVGIGIATPDSPLTVNNNGVADGAFILKVKGTAGEGGFKRRGTDLETVSNMATFSALRVGSAYAGNVPTDGKALFAGQVGIGTATPSVAQLHVVNTSGAQVARFESMNSSGTYVSIDNNGQNVGLIGSGSYLLSGGVRDLALLTEGAIVLSAGTAPRLAVNANGNVGIGTGTTAPTAKLEVVGDTKVSGNLAVGGGATVTGLTATNVLAVTSNATVGGNATIAGLTTTNTLGVTANATVGGNATITGVLSANTLNVTANATVGGNQTVTGSVTAGGALNAASLTSNTGVMTGGSTNGLTLNAGGTDKNITLSPSGTGIVAVGSGVTGVLKIFGTTASTSPITGSLINAGGFGNAGKAFFGDDVTVGTVSILPASSTVRINNGRQFDLVGTSASLKWRDGTAAQDIWSYTQATGTNLFSSATASTNSTSGALVVTGGAGIGGSVNTGGSLNVTANANVGGTFGVSGATTLTGPTTATTLTVTSTAAIQGASTFGNTMTFASGATTMGQIVWSDTPVTSTQFTAAAGRALLLGANGSAATGLTISTAGNVGVGTTGPAEKLEVVGNAKITGNVAVSGTTTTGSMNVTGTLTASTIVSATGNTNLSLDSAGTGTVNIGGGEHAGGGIYLGSASNGRMTYAGNFLPHAGNAFNLGTQAAGGRWMNGYFAGTVFAASFVAEAGTLAGRSAAGSSNGLTLLPTETDDSKNIILLPTGTGKVGIGTANPTYKLSVNGTIRAREVIVENTDWSDYVFAPDYQLAPLSEVERHIKEHRHLPGVPSAQAVTEQGVSLGEMQATLLAKIEELTLHMIEQEKRLAAQADRLERLETENRALKSVH